MAKVCEICDKRALAGNKRSHSNTSTKRKMGINLQSKKIGNKKVTICTSCLKTLKKLKKQTTV
jgi:ribosomal protein L28